MTQIDVNQYKNNPNYTVINNSDGSMIIQKKTENYTAYRRHYSNDKFDEQTSTYSPHVIYVLRDGAVREEFPEVYQYKSRGSGNYERWNTFSRQINQYDSDGKLVKTTNYMLGGSNGKLLPKKSADTLYNPNTGKVNQSRTFERDEQGRSSKAYLPGGYYDKNPSMAPEPSRLSNAPTGIIEQKVQLQSGVKGGDDSGYVNPLTKERTLESTKEKISQPGKAAPIILDESNTLEARRKQENVKPFIEKLKNVAQAPFTLITDNKMLPKVTKESKSYGELVAESNFNPMTGEYDAGAWEGKSAEDVLTKRTNTWGLWDREQKEKQQSGEKIIETFAKAKPIMMSEQAEINRFASDESEYEWQQVNPKYESYINPLMLEKRTENQQLLDMGMITLEQAEKRDQAYYEQVSKEAIAKLEPEVKENFEKTMGQYVAGREDKVKPLFDELNVSLRDIRLNTMSTFSENLGLRPVFEWSRNKAIEYDTKLKGYEEKYDYNELFNKSITKPSSLSVDDRKNLVEMQRLKLKGALSGSLSGMTQTIETPAVMFGVGLATGTLIPKGMAALSSAAYFKNSAIAHYALVGTKVAGAGLMLGYGAEITYDLYSRKGDRQDFWQTFGRRGAEVGGLMAGTYVGHNLLGGQKYTTKSEMLNRAYQMEHETLGWKFQQWRLGQQSSVPQSFKDVQRQQLTEAFLKPQGKVNVYDLPLNSVKKMSPREVKDTLNFARKQNLDVGGSLGEKAYLDKADLKIIGKSGDIDLGNQNFFRVKGTAKEYVTFMRSKGYSADITSATGIGKSRIVEVTVGGGGKVQFHNWMFTQQTPWVAATPKYTTPSGNKVSTVFPQRQLAQKWQGFLTNVDRGIKDVKHFDVLYRASVSARGGVYDPVTAPVSAYTQPAVTWNRLSLFERFGEFTKPKVTKYTLPSSYNYAGYVPAYLGSGYGSSKYNYKSGYKPVQRYTTKPYKQNYVYRQQYKPAYKPAYNYQGYKPAYYQPNYKSSYQPYKYSGYKYKPNYNPSYKYDYNYPYTYRYNYNYGQFRPTRFVPGFVFPPSLGGDATTSGMGGKGKNKRKYGYVASVEAMVQNIKGKVKSKPLYTGQEFRPIAM